MFNSPLALVLIVVALLFMLFNEAARKLAALLIILALTFALGWHFARSSSPLHAPASRSVSSRGTFQ